MKNLTLYARYGLKHELERISETTFRAADFNRFSYDRINEFGKFEGVNSIDFDGGPYLCVGYELPGTGRIIKEFSLSQVGERINFIDIITETAPETP